MSTWPFPTGAAERLAAQMSEPVAWAVTFVADEGNPERLVSRMAIVKDKARAEFYAGDPLKPHTEPRRIRPLVFGDDETP
jgi:hypothetical protein